MRAAVQGDKKQEKLKTQPVATCCCFISHMKITEAEGLGH